MTDPPRTASAPSAPQATTREFLAVLFRRRWIILGLFLVTTATVLGLAFSTPTAYVSSGRVLFKRGEQLSVLEPDRRIYGDWEQELGSEMQLIKSVPVLDRTRALLAEGVAPGQQPLDVAPGNVDVEVMGKSNVIAIGYHSADPQVAHRVCDALIRAYIDYRTNSMGVSYPEAFFRTQLGDVEHSINRLIEERRRYLAERGVGDVGDRTRALVQQLTAVQQQIAETEADLAEAQAGIDAMRRLQEQPGIDMPMENPLTGIDAMVRSQAEDPRPGDAGHPAARALSRRVAGGGQRAGDAPIAARHAQARSREPDAGADVAHLASAVAPGPRSSASETRVQTQLDAMPAAEAQMSRYDHDLQVLKDRNRELVEKSDLARVNETVVSRATVILLSPASPGTPTNTRDYVRIALAPAFSLVVGVGLAFFIDSLDITVRTAHHAEEAVELPVLATLPERRRRRVAS